MLVIPFACRSLLAHQLGERDRLLIVKERIAYSLVSVWRVTVNAIWKIRNRLDDDLMLLVRVERNRNARSFCKLSDFLGVIREALILLGPLLLSSDGQIPEGFSGNDESIRLGQWTLFLH